MQPRQYRPGDVLDDYCPRERRVTDHAIVAMVEDEIHRTRCVSCDAEHEYKNARVPASRKKASTATLFSQVLENVEAPARRVAPPDGTADRSVAAPDDRPAAAAPAPPAEPTPPPETEDRPFRRSLIRAQLPRPEGQPPPARAIPEFTMHQPQNTHGRRPPGQGRFRRRPGAGGDQGGPMRVGRDAGHGPGSGAGQGGRRRRRKKH